MDKDYYKEHEICPKCGCDEFDEKTIGYLDKNKNPCICLKCGWKGTVHDKVRRNNG